MTSKVSLPAGVQFMDAPAGFDVRKAAELLLAVGPSHLLAPVGTPLADPLTGLKKAVDKKNPIQLASAANRSVLFEPVPWGSASAAGVQEVPQTVQHGSFKLAEGFGTGTPAAPGRQPERPPQVQPERTPLTADERDAGEDDTQVAKMWFEKSTGSERTTMSGGEATGWEDAERRWDKFSREVWAREPDWRPEQGWWDNTAKGKIARLNDMADQAKKRLRELQREETEKRRREQGLPKEADKPTREYRQRFRGLLDPPL